MKRVVSLLSAICLLLAFLPAAVTAETYENLTYTVSGGKVTITDCAESVAGPITIPETIAGYPVTTIAISAFEDCAGLTAITIGKNVSLVGARAFAGCTALESITVAEGNAVYHSADNCLIETSSKTLVAGCKTSVIPADGTVTAVGSMAFYKCAGLTAVTVPDSVVSIGASAFEACTGLASVALGSKVASIGNSAFFGCAELAAVVIPDSVTTMGVYAFSGCTKLASVDIGDQLATIGNSAFAGCTALTDVTMGSGVKKIDVFAFNGCTKLNSVAVGSGVETIGKFAFYNCEALKTAQIGKNVSNIGSNAFSGCDQLRLTIDETNTYAISYAQNNGIDYTATGLNNIAVITVTLKPGVAGVYFGSNLDWAENDTRILSYGIAVSTENSLPVADDSDASSLYTAGTKSVLIKDIMKTGNTVQANKFNARKAVYARAYVQLENGEYIYSETVQASLQQVVIAAQNKWEKLSATQKDALTQMYAAYENVMSGWDVPNLK